MKNKKANDDLYRDAPRFPKKKLRLSLPLPPSINHMYMNTSHGGKRLTKHAENYVRVSRSLINLEIENQNWKKQNKSTWLYIDLVFYMPDKRIRDSHNMLKLLLDVMQDIVFDNDYYVMPNIKAVEYDKQNPRVEVKIYPQSESNRQKALMDFT